VLGDYSQFKMTATAHVLTGSAIAIIFKKPELAIPLALLSHFVNDMFPHFHHSKASAKVAKRIADIDTLVAVLSTLTLALAVTKVPGWLVIVCALAAILPDLVWVWRYYKLRDMDKMFIEPLSSFSRFHLKIQGGESQKLGAAVEISWVSLVVYLIIRFL
jgi:hypothetical protein